MNRTSEPPTPESPARVRRRWARRTLEVLIIGAALFLAVDLISEVGWHQLQAELQSAVPSLVAVTAALLAARYLAWNTRWQLSLRRLHGTPCFGLGLLALLAAAAVNHLTPSFRVFGGLLRARYVSRGCQRPFPTTYGAVLFDQIANQTIMGALSAIAFIAMALQLGRAGQAVAGVLATLALILLIPLLLRRWGRNRRPSAEQSDPDEVRSWLGRRLRPLADRSREVVDTIERLARQPTLLLNVAALSLLYAALNLAAAWAAFQALGHSVPFSSVFLTVSLGVTIGALSGTPGGSLTTEAAMVTCYGLLGIERPIALAATLLYRGLHYLLILTLGVPSLITLEVIHRRGPRD